MDCRVKPGNDECSMILIGQYDSPFVRRVAIAMRLYGLAFEHRPWSTFGDADKIAPYNPLRRVPTLVLDDGEVLIESAAMLDYLDELVGPERAMIAANGPARRHRRFDDLAAERVLLVVVEILAGDVFGGRLETGGAGLRVGRGGKCQYGQRGEHK